MGLTTGNPAQGREPVAWSVYVLVSGSGARTYVGVSSDPERRLLEHNGERPRGARSTRMDRPWSIVRILGPYRDRAIAQRVEHELKKKRGKARFAAAIPEA